MQTCSLLFASCKSLQRIRDDLLLSGQVDYGWFGITTTRKLNQENSFDIVINGFVDDSPAKDSKLKVSDILHTVGGVSIKTQGDLANASFFAEPDTILEFKVKRDGKYFMIPLKVTIRPQNQKLSSRSIQILMNQFELNSRP